MLQPPSTKKLFVKNFQIKIMRISEKFERTFGHKILGKIPNKLIPAAPLRNFLFLQPMKNEFRSYSPKLVNSKRKCNSCGKVKRISKCRKNTSNYCVCSKRETEKSEPNIPLKVSESSLTAFKRIQDCDENVPKSASYSNSQDMSTPKMGKLLRSKVYDFNAFKAEDLSADSDTIRVDSDASINVIVPTTRKIFAPLKQDENGGASAVVSFTIDETEDGKRDAIEKRPMGVQDNETHFTPLAIPDLRSKSISPSVLRRELAQGTPKSRKTILEMHANIDKLPPTSPISVKRNVNKEGNNSSIKLMIAHYNKLMTENPEKKLPEGQCWTPTLQKSPVLERCNRFETLTSSSQMNNIRKSKSAVLSTKNRKLEVHSGDSVQKENPCLGISKSCSADSIQCPRVDDRTGAKSNQPVEDNQTPDKRLETKTSPPELLDDGPANDSSTSINTMLSNTLSLERNSSFESVLSETKLRNLRLQEAKNRFFNEYPNKVTIQYSTAKPDQPTHNEIKNTVIEMDGKRPESRGSNLERDSTLNLNLNKSSSNLEAESSLNLALNKSVSTGNINDRSKSRNMPTGYEKSPSKSKFGLSNITAKFRKVRMRRHKEPEGGAVSSLCKASLFVNIDKDSKSKEYLNSSKSCPSSPVMQRNMSKRNSSSN